MFASKRVLGIALVALGSVFWSTAGLFVRLLDMDIWTMMVWRSLFAALSLGLIFVGRHGRATPAALHALGRPGLLAIPISAVSMFCYVASLKLTTVANVMMVYATLPFVGAGLSFLAMGERPKKHVLGASFVALAGVAIIAGSSTRMADVAGNSLALVMTLTFAVLLVIARRFPTLDMAPVNGFAAVICAAACWPLSSEVVPSLGSLGLLALFGSLTSGVAYLLVLTGGRYIPSSETGLVGFLDVVLAPLWVWFAFAEQPSTAALIGGAFVFAALVYYLLRELRAEDPVDRPSGRAKPLPDTVG